MIVEIYADIAKQIIITEAINVAREKNKANKYKNLCQLINAKLLSHL